VAMPSGKLWRALPHATPSPSEQKPIHPLHQTFVTESYRGVSVFKSRVLQAWNQLTKHGYPSESPQKSNHQELAVAFGVYANRHGSTCRSRRARPHGDQKRKQEPISAGVPNPWTQNFLHEKIAQT